MNVIELVGVLSGIVAVYLLYKNNIATWPVGFVNIGCFMLIFWQQKLYGDFVVQIIFLVTGILGWIYWNTKATKVPEYLNKRDLIVWLISTLICIPLVAYYLKNYTDCSYPLAEASILIISIAGQCLTALRKIENWYWWLLVDLIMIMVYAKKELYPTAAYAAIVFIIGVFGLLEWRKMNMNKI